MGGAMTRDDIIRIGLEIRWLREAMPDRRERIATEAMKALLSGPPPDRITYGQLAQHAVYCAEALIAELDKPKEVKP